MPPLVIAGVAAAVGTIGAAALSSGAQKSASNQAAQTQNAATQAQVQLGQQSLALNQGIYNSNYGLLSPFVSRGNVAGNQINALLGLGSAPAMSSPLAGGAPSLMGSTALSTPARQAPARGFPTGDGSPVGSAYPTGLSPAQMRDVHAQRAGMQQRPGLNGPPVPSAPGQVMQTGTPAAPAPSPASTPGATPASASSALNAFANSAGMQFQLDQGTHAINNLYAGRGALQSGAAMKAIQDYGQHTALDNYFMPYMGLLSGQQSVGAQAGSAVAGVGSTFGNTAAAINANMGNAINSGAQNIGNLQLANGQNQGNMWGRVGGALSNFGAQAFGGGGFNPGASYAAANASPWSTNLPSSAPYGSMPGGLY